MPEASPTPRNRYVSFPCSGVLTEIATPAAVGGSGLTACQNLTYHRQGAWGKRTGSSREQINFGTYPTNPTPVSGCRWYRAYPQPITKLVVYAQGTLMIGNDHFSLEPIGSFALSGSTAPSFCSMRDPQANYSVKGGADVLIIAGLGVSRMGASVRGRYDKRLAGASADELLDDHGSERFGRTDHDAEILYASNRQPGVHRQRSRHAT